MFCGTRSFSGDIDDDGGSRASSPRPKLSKLKQSLSLDRGKKQISNPYSKEGLDKFEKLVAELEAKKEEVLLKKNKKKKGSDQDSTTTTIVRFKYNSDTGDWIPIVVRLQPPEEAKKALRASTTTEEREVVIKEEVAGEKKVGRSIDVQHFWAMRIVVVVVVVLLVSCCFLLIGRAFVVCSATILWYVAPMMNNSEGSWDWKVCGKRLMISTDKWLARNLGVVAPSSSSSSMNVKKLSWFPNPGDRL
ncbi:uncharacterized protein M6B38_192860 [Iris pallida]|uniref:Uncharacterized protein n=1 Tax=Iris pallida TaxID=29817 RepID=A0AAX6EDG3_IRIPA|nr:uncharacterized protein M6B38_192860 [Iris pallida]